MGHYDTCRPENCSGCGQLKGICDCEKKMNNADAKREAANARRRQRRAELKATKNGKIDIKALLNDPNSDHHNVIRRIPNENIKEMEKRAKEHSKKKANKSVKEPNLEKMVTQLVKKSLADIEQKLVKTLMKELKTKSKKKKQK